VTGASIVTGEHELFGRSDLRLKDGAQLKAGNTRFVALHTPGHTPESVCYAVYREDAGERCWALFSGDALFVGETGRTDLADPARTAQNAGLLYDALHAKIAPLGDQALLYPAHGSGSACGGNIAERDESTLGIEKGTNPAFTKSREEFIRHKLSEKLPRPPYFRHMEKVNLEGGRPLPSLQRVALLPPREFERSSKLGIVVDTRSPDAFASAHIPGSYNVWLGGLATFGGWLADEGTPVFLVVDAPGEVETAVLSLARVGIDSISGVLAGGIAEWREQGLPIAEFGTTSAREAAQWKKRGEALMLDVRDEHEWSEGHIPGALHVYVGHLEDSLGELEPAKGKRLVVHCSVGNRAGLAASMLHRHGVGNVYNMLGGISAWRSLNLPLER
jgi:hydroxyacylglutathione hydrolase